MSIISLVKATLFREKTRSKKYDEEKSGNSSVCIAANILRNMALDCSCGEIAVFVGQRGSVYRCVRCNKETVGPVYNLDRTNCMESTSESNTPFFDMDFYNEAIILLSSNSRKRPTLKQWKYRLKH
jgi:hypothetical protein